MTTVLYRDGCIYVFLDGDDIQIDVDGERQFRCHRLDIETMSSESHDEVRIETYSGPYVKLQVPEDGDAVRLMEAIQANRE